MSDYEQKLADIVESSPDSEVVNRVMSMSDEEVEREYKRLKYQTKIDRLVEQYGHLEEVKRIMAMSDEEVYQAYKTQKYERKLAALPVDEE